MGIHRPLILITILIAAITASTAQNKPKKLLTVALSSAQSQESSLKALARGAQNDLPAKIDFKAPIPAEARARYRRADELYRERRFEEALVEVRKALAIAPQCMPAHKLYVDYQLALTYQPEAIAQEYRIGMARDPKNPVYPLVLALGFGLTNTATENERMHAIAAELAPDWSWGQFALGWIGRIDRNEEKEIAAFKKAIELEPDELYFRSNLAWELNRLHRYDEAIDVFQHTLLIYPKNYDAYEGVWSSKLSKVAGTNHEANAQAEVEREVAAWFGRTEKSPQALNFLARMYRRLVKSEQKAQATEADLKRTYPNWQPRLGVSMTRNLFNLTGLPRLYVTAGKRWGLEQKVRQAGAQPTEKRIAALEEIDVTLIDDGMKPYYYDRLFRAYREANGSVRKLEATARELVKLEPENIGVLDELAQEMLEQNVQPTRTLAFARRVVNSTKEFKPSAQPDNIDDAFWQETFNEQIQRRSYTERRATYLSTLGWAYYQTRQYGQAERYLRESVAMRKDVEGLYRLGRALDKRGRTREAAERLADALVLSGLNEEEKIRAALGDLEHRATADIKTIITEAEAQKLVKDRAQVTKILIDEPAKDFELVGVTGEHYRLSELKGKVVLINFWATWCGPCRPELQHLNGLYNQYKAQGFEILALSVDGEKHLVGPFVLENKLPFPVLYAEKTGELYQLAGGPPLTLIIDRNGRIRWRKAGFREGDERRYAIVIEELLKKSSSNGTRRITCLDTKSRCPYVKHPIEDFTLRVEDFTPGMEGFTDQVSAKRTRISRTLVPVGPVATTSPSATKNE